MRWCARGKMGGCRRRAAGKSRRRETLDYMSKANRCCLWWRCRTVEAFGLGGGLTDAEGSYQLERLAAALLCARESRLPMWKAAQMTGAQLTLSLWVVELPISVRITESGRERFSSPMVAARCAHELCARAGEALATHRRRQWQYPTLGLHRPCAAAPAPRCVRLCQSLYKRSDCRPG